MLVCVCEWGEVGVVLVKSFIPPLYLFNSQLDANPKNLVIKGNETKPL